jgi:hypothetical protein
MPPSTLHTHFILFYIFSQFLPKTLTLSLIFCIKSKIIALVLSYLISLDEICITKEEMKSMNTRVPSTIIGALIRKYYRLGASSFDFHVIDVFFFLLFFLPLHIVVIIHVDLHNFTVTALSHICAFFSVFFFKSLYFFILNNNDNDENDEMDDDDDDDGRVLCKEKKEWN